MKTSLFILSLGIGGILLMGSLKLGSIFPWIQIDDEKTYSLAEVKEIQVSMTSEDIHIYQAAAGSEVRFHYYGKTWPERRMFTKNVDGMVTVRAEEKPAMGTLKLDVYLPVDYKKPLGVKASSGGVDIESFDLADLRVNVSSGDIQIDSLKSPSVSIHSSSGEVETAAIEADRLVVISSSGDIKSGVCTASETIMEASSGSIQVDGVTGDVNLKSSSGDIHVTYTGQGNPNLKAESTSGSITAALPAEAEFTLDARATSGEVESAFPITVSGRSNEHLLSGRVGSGAGQVTLKATSGDIRIVVK